MIPPINDAGYIKYINKRIEIGITTTPAYRSIENWLGRIKKSIKEFAKLNLDIPNKNRSINPPNERMVNRDVIIGSIWNTATNWLSISDTMDLDWYWSPNIEPTPTAIINKSITQIPYECTGKEGAKQIGAITKNVQRVEKNVGGANQDLLSLFILKLKATMSDTGIKSGKFILPCKYVKLNLIWKDPWQNNINRCRCNHGICCCNYTKLGKED